MSTDRSPTDARVLWIGVGTKDIGLSLTQLTFQITHAIDSDTNAERDYIVRELSSHHLIEHIISSRSISLWRTRQTTTLPTGK